MTTRPGTGALALHSNHRGKRLCNVVRIRASNGRELRLTDHDRTLTFDGEKYVPIVFAGMSAERREVALRTPDQDLHGVIDRDRITIPDLLGRRYNEAEVWHAITDWQYPWLPVARHYKRVRAIEWDQGAWKAELEGITIVLERSSGGRFGGVGSYECRYRLGDAATCKKDLTALSHYGARVDTVTDDRLDFTITASSWSGTWADDYYRYGEIEWLWGDRQEWGVTSATTTTTLLTDSGGALPTDGSLIGLTVRVLNTAMGIVKGWATITDNTATTISYVDTNGNMGGWSAPHDYDIVPDSVNVGEVSKIEKYVDGTRRIELFTPTSFAIVPGESGIVRPGCDGLFSTCDTKFANHLNFGGWHLQPKPGDNLEPVQ